MGEEAFESISKFLIRKRYYSQFALVLKTCTQPSPICAKLKIHLQLNSAKASYLGGPDSAHLVKALCV